MKATSVGSYRSKNKGVPVFRYEVSGTKEELEAYELAQGDNYRETEDGKPLFFTTRFAGKTVDLIITQSDKVIADMSQYEAAASLAKQYGGDLGAELAKAAAAQLLGGFSTPAVSTPVQTPAGDDKL